MERCGVHCMYRDHRESSDSDSACLVGLGPELCKTYLVRLYLLDSRRDNDVGVAS